VDRRFDGDPEDEHQDRQESQKADNPDSGSELEGQQGEGEGDKQIGEQRPAGGGTGRDVARQAHHFSPARR
jgi:hypothetical protein